MSYTRGPYKRRFWEVFDNDGNKLADFDVSVENAQLDPQTVIDNANLFVAGPDLVEVLEETLRAIKMIDGYKQDFDQEWLEQVHRKGVLALTKAKGGQA